MNRILRTAVMSFSGLLIWSGNPVYAQTATQKEKKSIYVGPMKVKKNVVLEMEERPQLKRDFLAAYDLVESQIGVVLGEAVFFTKMDRINLKDMEEEKKWKAVLDDGKGDNIEALKQKGADYAFFPVIDLFEFGESREGGVQLDGVRNADNDNRTFTMQISGTVVIVDVSTTKTIGTARVEWGPKTIEVDDGGAVVFATRCKQMKLDMCKDFANDALAKATNMALPPRVSKVNDEAEGRIATVNRNSKFGFRPGVTVRFFAPEPDEDLDTGEKTVSAGPEAGFGVVIRENNRNSFIRIDREKKELPIMREYYAEPVAGAPAPNVSVSGQAQGQPVVPLAVAPVVMATPIANPDGVMPPSGSAVTPPPPAPLKPNVTFTNKKLANAIAVNNVIGGTTATGCLKVTVVLKAKEHTAALGTFKWYDAAGAPIIPNSMPVTIFLPGNSATPVVGIAADQRAKSFELVIEPKQK